MSDARWVGRWRRSREALLYTWILADRKRNWSGSKFGQTGNTCPRLDRSGNILSSHMFDAYGAEYDQPSGTKAGVFGFGGQWGCTAAGETSLILLTRRFCDPAQGRFLTAW